MKHEPSNHTGNQPMDVSEQTRPAEAGPESTARSAISGCNCAVRSLLVTVPLAVIPIIAVFLVATLVLPPPTPRDWPPRDGLSDLAQLKDVPRPRSSWQAHRERAGVVILLLLAMLALGRMGASRKIAPGRFPRAPGASIRNFGRSLAVGVIATVAATGTLAIVLVCGVVLGLLKLTGPGGVVLTSAERLAWLVAATLGIVFGVWFGFVLCRRLRQPEE
jgi:hypothetical protein